MLAYREACRRRLKPRQSADTVGAERTSFLKISAGEQHYTTQV